MPPKTIEIKVDIISDPNGKGKVRSAVSDIEKDVLASQKRVQAASKATDRAIAESQKQVVNAAKIGAKSQADKVIQELKRTETAAKQSADSIQGALKSAFGGGLIGGAIGGFAGSIVAQFTSALSQLPSVFEAQITEMTRIASERQNAFKGLESMSKFLGLSPEDTQSAVKNLRLVKAGVVDIGDATVGLKNLLSSGFSLPQATKLLEAFSDTAAFGKSAALGFGEAIRGATEGIRNGNSILVDNVGLTKNLTNILKDAGFAETDLGKVKQDANIRQALYNGLLKEALPQMGDADKLTQGWAGNTAALTQAQTNLYAALGNVIIRNQDLNALIQTMTGDLRSLTAQMEDTSSGWSKMVDGMTSSFSHFIFTLEMDIQRGIANLKDLGNDLDWIFSRLMAVGAASQGDLAGAAAYWQRADAAGGRKNANTNYFDNVVAPRSKSAFSSSVSTQRQAAAGQQNIFTSPGSGLLTGIPNNVAFPGMLGTTGPGTYAGGGPITPSAGGAARSPRRLPRTKSPKVNINLKDEMSDALDIAAKYGFTVTSGKDGTHNAGSAHGSGGAFDLRASGVAPGVFEAAMRELRGVGYYVKDERTHPIGQKVWSGPHMHVGGRVTSKKRTRDQQAIARAVGEWTSTDALGLPMPESHLPDEIAGHEGQIEANNKLIQRNQDLIDVYDHLDQAIFDTVDRTEEEIMTRKIALGFIKDLTEEEKAFLIIRAREIDQAKEAADKKREQEEFDKRVVSEIENIKREEYRKTRDQIEESLDYISRGDFKGLAKSYMERQRQQLVQKGTDFIMNALGIENPDDTPELKEARKQTQLLSQIAKGVGMPGTTGLGSTLTSTIGGIFGGGGGMGPGGTPPFIGNFAGGSRGPDLYGGGGNLSPAGGGGFLSKIFGGIGGGGGSSGGGLSGMLRGMGGGSKMAGAAAGIGQIAAMAGSAIGGKWGNVLSLTGMGASVGAQVGGPWGAAIGAAIGFGASMLQFLFHDNSEKKLKEAALSTYGITVKDKSVLKALKQLGESMFGKGKAGANAQAIVSSDQGETILRNYAEATGQNTKMMDRMHFGDENWSGNQFRSGFSGFGASTASKISGFKANGGFVSTGRPYIGGQASFASNGFSTVGGGDQQMKVILGSIEEALASFTNKFGGVPPSHVVMAGVAENPDVIGDAMIGQASRQDVADASARATGRAW